MYRISRIPIANLAPVVPCARVMDSSGWFPEILPWGARLRARLLRAAGKVIPAQISAELQTDGEPVVISPATTRACRAQARRRPPMGERSG